MMTWKFVPVEATEEQAQAAYRDQPNVINAGFIQAYAVMVAAAPPAPRRDPSLWICFAEQQGDPDKNNLRVRAWTANEDRARQMIETGLAMIPMFGEPPTRDEAFDAYRRTMTRIVEDLRTRLDKVKDETATALRSARAAALDAAMETLQSLRHVAATDFNSPNCQGQRGSDRCDAFFDAYTALDEMKRTAGGSQLSAETDRVLAAFEIGYCWARGLHGQNVEDSRAVGRTLQSYIFDGLNIDFDGFNSFESGDAGIVEAKKRIKAALAAQSGGVPQEAPVLTRDQIIQIIINCLDIDFPKDAVVSVDGIGAAADAILTLSRPNQQTES